MEKLVNFNDFINEDFNGAKDWSCNEPLAKEWYYYNVDDDIIYGCDERPDNDSSPIIFQPFPFFVCLDGVDYTEDPKIYKSDFLITYDMETAMSSVYNTHDEIRKYLKGIGVKRANLNRYTRNDMELIQSAFESCPDMKHILIISDKLVASTFDIIEEE